MAPTLLDDGLVGGPPKVSVVIPVRDGERYLREGLESVLAQDRRPLEVIVVDDGSEDDTAEIARSLPDVRYLRQERLGVAAARNAGIEASTGALVAFHDHDDLMLPGKLRIQWEHLRDHPEIGVVLARCEVMVDPGVERPAWLDRIAERGPVGPVGGMMARRSVLDLVGGFDPGFAVAEGMQWLGRVREAGIGIEVPDRVLFRWRFHGQNASRAVQEMREGLVRGVRDRLARRRAASGEGS